MKPISPNILFIPHSTIDKQKWDNCIRASENKIVYALSSFLDALSPGWDALIMEDYKAVMPLVSNRKFFIRYIYNLPFSARLGVFSETDLDNTLISKFLNSIPLRYKLVQLKFNTYNYQPVKGFVLKENVNYELLLSKPYEELSKSFSKNHRKNIHSAYKNNVICEKTNDVSPMIDLKKEVLSKKKIKMNMNHFNKLSAFLNDFQKKGKCTSYIAYDSSGNICASAVFLIEFGRAVIFSATNSEAKKNLAGYLIVDTFIREMAGQNVILDFAGSNIKGIADYNSGFGSIKHKFPEYSQNNLNFPFSLFKK